jgi:hypothetical protein
LARLRLLFGVFCQPVSMATSPRAVKQGVFEGLRAGFEKGAIVVDLVMLRERLDARD